MCDECHGRKIECYIALTIEKKLKAYSECPDHTERHEILWHEWNHNKRWLIQLQELILPSFPSYSRHDVSHSEAVIHNIEMLLGEKNIMELSATDCFVILHTVYIHDIGMCITHADREEILANTKFREYIESLAKETDSEMGNYARVLLQECFKSPDPKDKDYVLKKKLEVYYAIIYLIAEHRRREHGEVSEKRMISWIDDPDKLGIGFSTIDIPSRLFYIIANCASTHTKWDFGEVLKLKQEDSGFALDYVHPRFVAVLLQLGDALDMDNNRFHPLTEEFLGRIPEQSTVHWNKHKAIKRLRITNEKISISADCKSQEELRVVRTECDGIESILKSATFYWSVIRPKESNACLPTLDKVELLLQGKPISKDLVKAQFEIPQEKAFNLLMGNNIYTDHNFVFLRELLQNAVDATKIQYFRDYQKKLRKTIGRKIKQSIDEQNAVVGDISAMTPSDIGRVIEPFDYQVKIELSIKKKCATSDNITYMDVTENDIKNPQKEGCEYGVLVRVRDYGIGIDQNDIERISKIGSSYKSKMEETKKMPRWLQPTGTFGIGLQSVFLVGKELVAYTHAYNSDPYEIHFYPRQEGKRGYINVMPLEYDGIEPYGSCFEVFVPYDKKQRHCENPETWDGSDPFESNYENTKAVRHSRELLKQMALYLASIVGEPLFPINLEIYDCEKQDGVEKYYDDNFFKVFHNMEVWVYDRDGEEHHKKKDSKSADFQEEEQFNVTWAYNFNKSRSAKSRDTYIDPTTKDSYSLDWDECKIYIWNQKCSTYACVGIERILRMRDNMNSPDMRCKKKDGVDIYYKGILLTTAEFEEDANLIEYMDIKGTVAMEDLKLNRNGFSKKGYEDLKCIYREILKTARKALKHYGENSKNIVEKIRKKIFSFVEIPKLEQQSSFGDTEADQGADSNFEATVESMGKIDLDAKKNAITAIPKLIDASDEQKLELEQELDRMLLSAAALVYFSMIDEQGETTFKNLRTADNAWKDLLKEIIDKKIWMALPNLGKSALYNIPLGKTTETGEAAVVSIFDIIDSRNKYMVVSQRDIAHRWKQRLVRVDEYHKSIKEKIKRLRIETSVDERKKLMLQIESELSQLKKNMDIEERFFEARANIDPEKEQRILKWILENIPTMALYASADGDFRINLLDVEVCDSVYYSLEMKKLIIDRLLTESEIANRFTVPVVSGFSVLSLREARESILFVKRGKLSPIGYREMIFPLTGEQLKNELELDRDNYKGLKDKIEAISKLGEMTLYKVANMFKSDNSTEYNRFLGDIQRCMANSYEDQENEIQEYNENVLEQIKNAYIKGLQSEVWEKYLNPVVSKIRIEYGNDDTAEIENELAEHLYKKYCVKSSEFKNIKKFIQEYGKLQLSEELVENTYRRYMYELAMVMVKMIKNQLWAEHVKDKNIKVVNDIKAALNHEFVESVAVVKK